MNLVVNMYTHDYDMRDTESLLLVYSDNMTLTHAKDGEKRAYIRVKEHASYFGSNNGRTILGLSFSA